MSVKRLCAWAGFSRQAYYKVCHRREGQEVDDEAVLALVKRERSLQPRLGARKLLALLAPELQSMDIALGRDRFFRLLRCHEQLIVRRRRGPQTTDSRHGYRKWPNAIRHVTATMVHQVWFSDLTYIRTDEGFMYLCLVMDAFSRKVVGYDISDSLEADGCLRALHMALGKLPPGACPFHHSDRGTQYCCREYVQTLERRGCPISMTEMSHCYENATAERLNGILKDEYGLNHTFSTKTSAIEAALQAIWLYNERRPHTSLDNRTPSAVHRDSAA